MATTFVLFEGFHNFQLEGYQKYIGNPYELDILMLILEPCFFQKLQNFEHFP